MEVSSNGRGAVFAAASAGKIRGRGGAVKQGGSSFQFADDELFCAAVDGETAGGGGDEGAGKSAADGPGGGGSAGRGVARRRIPPV